MEVNSDMSVRRRWRVARVRHQITAPPRIFVLPRPRLAA
jgi:hypothetical protein